MLLEVESSAGEQTTQKEVTWIEIRITIRELKGRQLQTAIDALLSAYGSEGTFAQMVAVSPEENLAGIAGGNNLRDKVFSRLEWARMRGRLTELLQVVIDGNPTNPALREFVESLNQ